MNFAILIICLILLVCCFMAIPLGVTVVLYIIDVVKHAIRKTPMF